MEESDTKTLYHLFSSHFSLPHPYIYLFPAPCTPLGPFVPFLSPFQPADPITPLIFPLRISPLLLSIQLFSKELLNPREEHGSPDAGWFGIGKDFTSSNTTPWLLNWRRWIAALSLCIPLSREPGRVQGLPTWFWLNPVLQEDGLPVRWAVR